MTDLWQAVNTGGVVGLLLIILVGGIKGWWVFGWVYQACEQRGDEWKRFALQGTSIAEKSVDLVRKRGKRSTDRE